MACYLFWLAALATPQPKSRPQPRPRAFFFFDGCNSQPQPQLYYREVPNLEFLLLNIVFNPNTFQVISQKIGKGFSFYGVTLTYADSAHIWILLSSKMFGICISQRDAIEKKPFSRSHDKRTTLNQICSKLGKENFFKVQHQLPWSSF